MLRLKQPDAQTFIDRVNGIEAPPPAEIRPEGVRVRVLNGTGVTGQAAEVSVALQGPGFNVADRGTATGKFPQTMIRYGSGAFDKAQLLQRYLRNGARLISDPSLRTVDTVLVIGSDYAGVLDKPAPVPPTTTPTTAPPKSSSPSTTIPPC